MPLGARVPRATRALTAALLLTGTNLGAAAPVALDEPVRRAIDVVIQPLMAAHDIPGMSVAVTQGGQAHVLHYGVTAQGQSTPVGDQTIFEIGSVSKVFTGTLGAWGIARKTLDPVLPASHYWPALAGTAFDRVNLLNLGTYTAGGLPLQFPDAVKEEADVLAYFQQWTPTADPAAQRQYSNPSIGLFGYLAARAENTDFDIAMVKELLPALGLQNTYLRVPQAQSGHYAFGVAKGDTRVRVSPGPLDAEAYGIKTTAGDLIRFVQLAIDPSALDGSLREAFALTQTGYYQVGGMRQGLGWEIYEDPFTLDTVLAGNTSTMALEPHAVRPVAQPTLSPTRFVNKTGSTRGFGAYAAFLPAEQLGVVMLANRNYPNGERVKAGWAILEALREPAVRVDTPR
ncbi:beta-lactamase [Achromobacter sp. GG226]|uniref:class C beta-lactamase n=1 Tax=Verticiella alkaliphila TaxID=2779529 RepID=UPI001C0E5EE5|nr:beta-lactamase [Verticiella sp. GG226]